MALVKKHPPGPVRSAMRAAVVESAARCFFRAGYLATTMESIAAEARVSVQTLYNSVGNKAAFLTEVFEVTVSGPNAPLPVPVFMRQRSQAAVDARGVVRVLADWFLEAHARMAPLWRIIDEAVGHDADVATFARTRAHQRLANYREAAHEIARPWQYFAVLLPVRTVGVLGDNRVHGEAVSVRIVESIDAMTATAMAVPRPVLSRISERITRALSGQVVRVLYDVTDKPPATIEWE